MLLLAFGATEYFYWPWGLFASNFISTLMLISISLVQILAFSVPLLKPKTSGSTPNASAKLEGGQSKTTLSSPSTLQSPRTDDSIHAAVSSRDLLAPANDTVIQLEQRNNTDTAPNDNASRDRESYESEISDSSFDSNIDENKLQGNITSDHDDEDSESDSPNESYPSTTRSVEVI